jgi:hypothetical protein
MNWNWASEPKRNWRNHPLCCHSLWNAACRTRARVETDVLFPFSRTEEASIAINFSARSFLHLMSRQREQQPSTLATFALSCRNTAQIVENLHNWGFFVQ